MLIALGTPLKGRPRPWEYFKVPALMVNAYEIIKNGRLRKEIQAKGLHEFLNYDGTIFLDSGGYQAMRRGIDIKIEDLVYIYKLANADFYFSLDYPSYESSSSKSKIEKTIANYERLIKIVENVIPIVHPDINRALIEFDAYKKYSPEYIAIGGLVPLVLTTKGLMNGRKKAIDLIAKMRMLHKGLLHLMGLGSPTLIPIIKILKCDSTDSSSWRIKAAHGKIMLPDGGERHVANKPAKFGCIKLTEEEKMSLERYKCPIMKEFDWEDIENLFEVRALFNAWITLFVSRNSFEISGPFTKLLSYAYNLITTNFTLDQQWIVD